VRIVRTRAAPVARVGDVGLEYLGKITRASANAGLLLALLFAAASMPRWGAGVVAGDLWAIANLYGVRFLIVRWIRPAADRRREPARWTIAAGLLIKFPLLYGLGYLMLKSGWFRIEGLVLGFLLPFAASFVDALGRFAAERRQSAVR
jgi:hypothetical protein